MYCKLFYDGEMPEFMPECPVLDRFQACNQLGME